MIKSILLTVAAVGAVLVCRAQAWSYQDCVDYARQHNINLQKSRITEQTGAVNLDEAKAQWQPTLDFSTSHGVANYPWRDGTKNSYTSNYAFSAGWTIYNGGERENNIKRKQLQTEIDKLNTGAVMRSLETDLLQVYLNILYAKESISICKEAVTLSGAQAERARQLMEGGKLSRVDYAQLQSQYEQDRYALVNAQGTYDTRKMELKKLLELGIDTDVELQDVDWSEEQILDMLPDMASTYELALRNDLQLQSLDLEKDGAGIDIDIAKAGKRPKISLNAGVLTGYNAPGGSFGNSVKQAFGENVGLSLTVPIFNNKQTKSAVARARLQQFDAQLSIDQRNNELSQLVENWFIDTRSSQARFVAAGEQLRAARLTSELTDEKFDLGLVNTVELMQAHNDLLEAQFGLLQAKYMAMLGHKMIEYYREAKITLP